MKHLGNIAVYLSLALNLIFICLLLLVAYSPYADPQSYPLYACMGLTFPVFLFINLCFLIFWLLVRYKMALVPLVGFLLCAPQIRTYIPFNFQMQKVPEQSIKLLSYNVMNFNTMAKVEGENPILNYIKESEADIVCIQEFVTSTNRKYLTQENVDDALKKYPYKNIQKLGKAKGNGIACYSRFPILSARMLDVESWGNGAVVYEIKVGNDTITLINNHLESNGLSHEDREAYESMIDAPEKEQIKKGAKHLLNKFAKAAAVRSAQAQVVAKKIATSSHKYVIACGDFNDSPISASHRIISEELDDAFVQSGCGVGVSFNQNKFYFRIDNIMISKNLKSYNCKVDRSIKDSDHYPIECYISKR